MILITKEESKLIKKYFPSVHIRRTTHKYYMAEYKSAVKFILDIRNDNEKCD